ncbi:MAG: SAM-dependent methyltransferase [Kofleriaceae bacterium]
MAGPAPHDDAHDEADDDASFSEHWQREVTARAAAHWTPERTAALAAGKTLLMPPAQAAPLLRALGLLHRDASMPPKQVRKYWQVSHMITLLGARLRELLARREPVRLLDAGCGRSYLSLALAWVAEHRWGARVQILGIDRNAQVIAECRRRSALAQLGGSLRFVPAALEELDPADAWRTAGFSSAEAPFALHGLISLHACDRASCAAIALAVRLRAELVAVAPCCQAELAARWAQLAERDAAGAFRAIWTQPHLRRETAADLTDAMRVSLLRACGYDAGAIEFVPAEHTRKNTLLRAHAAPLAATLPARRAALAQYHALVDASGGAGLDLAEQLAPFLP